MKDTCYRFLSLAINFQLLFSPLAIGQAVGTGDGLSSTGSKVGNTVRDVANIAGGLLGAAAPGGMQSMMRGNDLGIHPVNPAQLPPAIQQAGCAVFEAKTNTPDMNMCDPAMANMSPQGMQTVQQILSQAQSNLNDFDNYLRVGNASSTSQGKACLNKAAGQLQSLLKSRVETLNQFQKRIEEFVQNFEKNNEQLLRDIYKGDALLNGKKAKAGEKNLLADFDFAREFSDPACASSFSEQDISKWGEGGYSNIEEMLSNRVEKSSDNRSYSPDEIFSKENIIKRDVTRLVKDLHQNSVARNAQALDVQDSLKALNPREVSTQNPKIQEILTREIRDFNQDLQTKRQSIGESYWKMLEQGNINSKSVAAAFERDEYNRCLLRYVGDIEQFGNSVRNPTVSDAANSSRDLLLKTTIKENLRDNNIHIKQKIKNIQKEDIPGEKIRISASRNVCGKSLYGGQLIGVTQLMKLYECECDRVYKDRSEGSISASTVANHIESFDKYIKDKKKAFATQVHRKLDEELLRCPADTSTGVAKSSCNGALDKTSNNFCLRTAKVCAGNAKACLATANKKRVQTRNEQKQKAAIYKTRMAALKQTLQGEFKKQEQLIEMSSRTLDQQYGVGSVYNVPLELELNQSDDQLLGDLDASLLIEDPKAYLAAAQADIKKAKEKLEESNREIFGADPDQFKGRVDQGMVAGGGFLGKVAGYIENVEIEKERWSDIQQQCKETMMAISQGMQQQGQQQMQMAQICEQARAFKGANPCNDIGAGTLDVFAVTDSQTGNNSQSFFADFCNGQDSELEKISSASFEIRKAKVVNYCNENPEECACSADDTLCGTNKFCPSLSDRLDPSSTKKYCKDGEVLSPIEDGATCNGSTIIGSKLGVHLSEEDFAKYGDTLPLTSGGCVLPSEKPVISENAYRYSVNKGMLNQATAIASDERCAAVQTTDARTGEKDTGNYGIGRYLGSLINDGLGGGTAKQ